MLIQLLINLVKLIVCGIAFFVGMMIGGMLVTSLNLPAPAMPVGMDINRAMVYMVFSTPLLALALAVLARGLAGGFVVRALALSFLAWIAYTVNTQLETLIISPSASGFWFSVIDFLPAWLLCGIAVAWLFPPAAPGQSVAHASQAFFSRRHTLDWAWRLAVASVAFMPIYYFFGSLVLPFVGNYYAQNVAGLTAPTLDQLLPILFTRSVLFLLACLPLLVLWQKSETSLFWRLGLSLYILVGSMTVIADWLPWGLRIPHTLEIVADEFVYAGVLVLLLVRGSTVESHKPSAIEQKAAV